jgi:hypothetical protein
MRSSSVGDVFHLYRPTGLSKNMILNPRSIARGRIQRNGIVNTAWRAQGLCRVSVHQPVPVDLVDIMYQGASPGSTDVRTPFDFCSFFRTAGCSAVVTVLLIGECNNRGSTLLACHDRFVKIVQARVMFPLATSSAMAFLRGRFLSQLVANLSIRRMLAM